MRLTENNIKFVKELQLDGIAYEYYVSIKGGDSRTYINYENNKTVAKEYEFERLPKAVQNFIKNHQHRCRLFSEVEYKGSINSCYVYE